MSDIQTDANPNTEVPTDLSNSQQDSISDLKETFANAQKMAMATRKVTVMEQAKLDADKKQPH